MIKIYLSAILDERQITQIEVARQTGIRPSTINEMYNETTERLNLEHLNKICEYLHCHLNELIEYIPDKRISPKQYLSKKNKKTLLK